MATKSPFSSLSDPNSFFGPNFLPRLGKSISSIYENVGQSEDELRKGLGQAASRATTGLGRFASTIGNALTFPIKEAQKAVSGTPLIKGPALGRTRKPEAPTPEVTTLPSGTPMVGFDMYPTVKQSVIPPIDPSAQFATTGPRPATQDDIDYFYGRGQYSKNQQATPIPPQVAQPATKPASPYSNKVPIKTPYGTIYATPEQAARPRVAEIASLPADHMRLARIGEEARRSARIRQVREKAADTFRKQRLEREESSRIALAKKREEREEAARQKALREVDLPSRSERRRNSASRGTQTTQRSWSNYAGDRPIKRKRGTDFYEDSPYGGYA
jgi:hypothetical protein